MEGAIDQHESCLHRNHFVFWEVLILLIFMGEGRVFRISWNINHSKAEGTNFFVFSAPRSQL